MNNLANVHNGGADKPSFISFRCDPTWAHEVKRWALEHNTTTQALCIKAVSKLTGIKHPTSGK